MKQLEFENRLSAKDKTIRKQEALRLKILEKVNGAIAHIEGKQAVINLEYYEDCPACYHAGVARMFCQMCFDEGRVIA